MIHPSHFSRSSDDADLSEEAREALDELFTSVDALYYGEWDHNDLDLVRQNIDVLQNLTCPQ